MSDAVTESEIDMALCGMMRAFDAEYDAMSQADLEDRWHYRPDPTRPIERDLYEFFSMLTLYAGSCRRWEERHNGSSCVVERVRDTYTMPKLREFAAYLQVRADMSEWQDISTAPKDGTRHVRGLWVHSSKTGLPIYWEAIAGWIDHETGEFRDHDDNSPWSAEDYTHWHDLAAAPPPPARANVDEVQG